MAKQITIDAPDETTYAVVQVEGDVFAVVYINRHLADDIRAWQKVIRLLTGLIKEGASTIATWKAPE